ncbi:MAG TPA: NifB/NifX family molybdenum-iron cluster-binding protein [Smithellaceae bacterium]|nr:NifB/NifX family molybdenum-iron cluster-binding protein [Smithellaceae bacterium]
MKLALSVFKDCISTVFDSAEQLIIVETDGTANSRKTAHKLFAADPIKRATELKTLGVEVLICGAISRPMQSSIRSQGIAVHPFVRSAVEDVLSAYQNNRLALPVFSLPGCRGKADGCYRKQSRIRGQAPGARCRWRS